MIDQWCQLIPEDLVDAFQNAPAPTLFIGAGFGKEAIPPLKTGAELAEDLRILLKVADHGETLSELTQYLRNDRAGSDRVVIEWLKKQLADGQATFGGAHVLALKLPVKEILTTNYDSLLSDASHVAKIRVRGFDDPIAYKRDADSPSRDSVVLGYVHGSFQTRNVVITVDDYIKNYTKSVGNWKARIQQQLRSTRVVFIGYSLRDFTTWTTYISTLISEPRGNYPHVMVAPTTSPHLQTFWRELGVTYVPLKAYQFLIALHQRLGTLESDPLIAKAAAAACLGTTLESAEAHIEQLHATSGYKNLLSTTLSVIREHS